MASHQADIGIDHSYRNREVAVKIGLGLLLILAMSFIALPVMALFLKSPPDTILRSLHDTMVVDALRLSLMTSTITTIMVVIMGTPIAYVSARFNYFGKELADSLIDRWASSEYHYVSP